MILVRVGDGMAVVVAFSLPRAEADSRTCGPHLPGRGDRKSASVAPSFALPAGAMVDEVDRRRLVVTIDLLRSLRCWGLSRSAR